VLTRVRLGVRSGLPSLRLVTRCCGAGLWRVVRRGVLAGAEPGGERLGAVTGSYCALASHAAVVVLP